MARASVRTKLSLDAFSRRLSYSPLLFNQVVIEQDSGRVAMQAAVACSDPILQYTWQPLAGGRPGREEIAEAIAQAEGIMEQYLGYPLLPTWIADDTVIPTRPSSPLRGLGNWNPLANPWLFSVKASNGYIITGGQEGWETIMLAAAVGYSDDDGDSYKETATVTVATTVSDPDQIVVYYPGEEHNEAWEIRPIKVSIAAGVATITFARQQAVKPELLEALGAEGVDGMDDASFLATVDVYRQYNDPSQQAVVEWESAVCNADACMVEADTGCFYSYDPRNSIVRIHAGTWDADGELWSHNYCAWWGRPDRVRLWYRAGYRGTNLARPMHDMDPQLERAVAYLALSYLDREWQSCEAMRNMQSHWRTDLALRESNTSQSSSFQVSRKVLDNPFGTTRAAVFAWNIVAPKMIGQAVTGD